MDIILISRLLFLIGFIIFPSDAEKVSRGPGVCSYSQSSADCGFKPAANCNEKGLTDIPKNLPANISCLWMSYNKLEVLRGRAFNSYPGLETIHLDHNVLREIDDGAFMFQYQLKDLWLSNNMLDMQNRTSVPTQAFQWLGGLRVLRINQRSDPFETLSSQDNHVYRDDLFVYMTELREIHLDGLAKGTPFPLGFARLGKLQTLNVYGNFNFISNLTFSNLKMTNISSLSINSGELQDLEPNAFGHFPNLKYLSLNNNMKLGFDRMSGGCWYGLQYSQIETLSLKRCTDGKVRGSAGVLTTDFFRHLAMTKLRNLYLDDNILIDIDAEMHLFVPHLEVLSLAYNLLQDLEKVMADIAKFKHLKYLYISYQQKRAFLHEGGAFSHEAQTETVCNRGKWSMGHHQLALVKDFHFHLPETLTTLIMVQNMADWSFVMRNFTIHGPKNLSYIQYSSEYVNIWCGPFRIEKPDPKTSLTASLSGNAIKYLAPDFLRESIENGLNLSELDLFDNDLGFQILKDVVGELTVSMEGLKILNLAKNNIELIPPKVLNNLHALKVLNISQNSLREISLNSLHQSNLESIDLSCNFISNLDKEVRTNLDAIAMHNSLKLDLMGNPLICSCETLEFILWMNTTIVNVLDHHNYICSLDEDFITLEEFYTNHRLHLEKKCSSRTYLLVSVLGIFFAILMIALSVVAYRQRKDIQFFCALYVQKRRKYQALIEDDVTYKYDAFVAYHNNDNWWVVHHLLKNLENPIQDSDKKFLLCLHHRDFVPGNAISDNIIESISNSRKTILILSKKFVQSSWCDFEVNMARIKCFDEKKDLIVIIMLEQVDPREMTKTLRAMVRRITYISWPNDLDQHPKFWESLRKTLSSPHTRPLKCECGRYVTEKGHVSQSNMKSV